MIYLIKVKYKKLTLLKVEYAEDIKKRISQYTTENPLFELLDYREGDRRLESFLHDLFQEYKFNKGREWFYYSDYIVENFRIDPKSSDIIEKINNKIKSTNKSFSARLKSYCSFKEKYPEIDFKDDQLEKFYVLLGVEKLKELRYKEDLTYRELNKKLYGNLEAEDENILNNFLEDQFFKATFFQDRMKLFCEFADKYSGNNLLIEELFKKVSLVNKLYPLFYRFYGTKGCSARGYRKNILERDWKESDKSDFLKEEIFREFSVNDRYSKSDIKLKLKEIYQKLSLSKTAKATDLGDYFRLSKTSITTPEGLKNGFKLGERLQ